MFMNSLCPSLGKNCLEIESNQIKSSIRPQIRSIHINTNN